jgi:hypothetical protein
MAYNLRKAVPVSGASQTINFDHSNGSSEVIIFVTSNTSIINLPNPTGWDNRLLIKKMSASGTITVQPPAGVTIDGQANYNLASQYKYVELLYDGSGNLGRYW